ncbi:hypothetical protein ACGFRG_23635 [Streptomyces sp. NPDC048696]|uniref:hypothetical protein n=1 Tax=Streptomyces sp. NPDC048696 TaxID=3365585 RepID=UPI00371D6D22
MPSELHYQIVTDPTSLQASRPGAPSVGAVHVVISNTHLIDIRVRHIDVVIPTGNDSDALTDKVAAIKPRLTQPYATPPGEEDPEFTRHSGNRFRLSRRSKQLMTLPAQEYLVLKLENIPVSEHAGLALLVIHEIAGRGPLGTNPSCTALAVVKQTPQVPQNFRADESLVGADKNVVLRWDGPDSLKYWIRYPDGGPLEPVNPPVRPTPVPYGPHSHTPTRPLKRGSTYTLVAGTADNSGQVQEGYFLTTTVHARIPEFESGTRTPWVEGTTDRGRVTFTTDGVKVETDDPKHVLGTVKARTVDVHDVKADKVKGQTAASGWIDFPDTGIHVYHGPNPDLGVVTADRTDVNGVNTKWVGDHAAGNGWIEFPKSGTTVHKDGSQQLGTVSAHTAALNSVTAQWVEGPNGTKSRLAFTDTGVKITDPDKHRGTIVAGETNVRSVVTPWVSGPMPGAGWIAFRVEGVDVMRDSEVSFGTIRAATYEVKQGGTGRALHRRLPAYEWPPKSGNQTPSTSGSKLREDPE